MCVQVENNTFSKLFEMVSTPLHLLLDTSEVSIQIVNFLHFCSSPKPYLACRCLVAALEGPALEGALRISLLLVVSQPKEDLVGTCGLGGTDGQGGIYGLCRIAVLKNFHRIGPLGRFGLVVAMSVRMYLVCNLSP